MTVYRLFGPRIDQNMKSPKHKITKENLARHLCEQTNINFLKIWSEIIAGGETDSLIIKKIFTQLCAMIEDNKNIRIGLKLQKEIDFQGGLADVMTSFFSNEQKKGTIRSDISTKNMVEALFNNLHLGNKITQILLDGFYKLDQ